MDRHTQHIRREIALTADAQQQLILDEDLDIFRINTRKIFRAALELKTTVDNMPDLQAQAADAVRGGQEVLDEAIAELDAARDRKDEVTAEIAKWKEELAAAA
jgi:hypothetical protein